MLIGCHENFCINPLGPSRKRKPVHQGWIGTSGRHFLISLEEQWVFLIAWETLIDSRMDKWETCERLGC
jgi:hypothetical protein